MFGRKEVSANRASDIRPQVDNHTPLVMLLWFKMMNTYILLDVLLCSIAEYFYELCRILTSP